MDEQIHIGHPGPFLDLLDGQLTLPLHEYFGEAILHKRHSFPENLCK